MKIRSITLSLFLFGLGACAHPKPISHTAGECTMHCCDHAGRKDCSSSMKDEHECPMMEDSKDCPMMKEGGKCLEQKRSSGEFQRGATLPVAVMGGKVPFDNILTGGQPTEENLKEAHTKGIQTIINLRPANEKPSPAEEEAWARKYRFHYVTLPISGPADVTRENAEKFNDLLKRYPFPVLVHCSTGNRVGAMFAMKAFFVDGKDADTAIAIGKDAGLAALENDVRSKLKR